MNVCVDVADSTQWSTSTPAAAAVNLQLPYFLASRQRQLITVAALTASLLFIYDGLQVGSISISLCLSCGESHISQIYSRSNAADALLNPDLINCTLEAAKILSDRQV